MQFSVFSFLVEVLYVISPSGVPFACHSSFFCQSDTILSVRYHFVSIVLHIPELIMILFQLDCNSWICCSGECRGVVVVVVVVVVVEALRWSC